MKWEASDIVAVFIVVFIAIGMYAYGRFHERREIRGQIRSYITTDEPIRPSLIIRVNLDQENDTDYVYYLTEKIIIK